MIHNSRPDPPSKLVEEIVALEWGMLQEVRSRGGRAGCQEDPDTFELIRTCNFMTWSKKALESYLEDLREAKGAGRNLMTEKYARMEGLLPPPPDPETIRLINAIVEKECGWVEEFAAANPDVKMARPVYSWQDTPNLISSETYAKGELGTYSRRTLELYRKDNEEMEKRGRNRIEIAIRLMLEKAAERR